MNSGGKEEWEFRYSDQERQAIVHAAPSPAPHGVDLDAEIRELEDAASIYIGVTETYKRRFKGRAPAWRKASKLLDKLLELSENDGLVELHKMLPGLPAARDRARVTADSTKMSARAHSSKRSPETRQLYDQVRSTYVKLGGELGVSRPKPGAPTKEPHGPAIRFFEAVLGPVMKEDMPGREGLVAIIKARPSS
ncbi:MULTISPECIES: hypothetical protein [Bradyrhizobium]|uniref:hypothetical protein n=1 Tax=Bradyrhizobium elkanii TaxID=29448 RepID=UPI000483C6F7|nr:hypothetical protein [Bradyrhizobium elkanii]